MSLVCGTASFFLVLLWASFLSCLFACLSNPLLLSENDIQMKRNLEFLFIGQLVLPSGMFLPPSLLIQACVFPRSSYILWFFASARVLLVSPFLSVIRLIFLILASLPFVSPFALPLLFLTQLRLLARLCSLFVSIYIFASNLW